MGTCCAADRNAKHGDTSAGGLASLMKTDVDGERYKTVDNLLEEYNISSLINHTPYSDLRICVHKATKEQRIMKIFNKKQSVGGLKSIVQTHIYSSH